MQISCNTVYAKSYNQNGIHYILMATLATHNHGNLGQHRNSVQHSIYAMSSPKLKFVHL